MANMTTQHSGPQSTSLQTGSLKEQPASTLRTAILSPSSEAATLKRTQIVLSAYYEPDVDPQTRAELRQEFVVALAHVPEWAMQRAFDRWVKTATRRPSPGEIVILAERELKPITDEMAARAAVQMRIHEDEQEAKIDRVTPEAAARIMAEAGLTPERLTALKRFPMAGSVAEALAKSKEWDKPAPHWSDTAPPDDPRWEMLRKSRATNELINQGKTE